MDAFTGRFGQEDARLRREGRCFVVVDDGAKFVATMVDCDDQLPSAGICILADSEEGAIAAYAAAMRQREARDNGFPHWRLAAAMDVRELAHYERVQNEVRAQPMPVAPPIEGDAWQVFAFVAAVRAESLRMRVHLDATAYQPDAIANALASGRSPRAYIETWLARYRRRKLHILPRWRRG